MTPNKSMTNLINKLPLIGGYINYVRNSHFPAGHYYSPIISVEDIKKREAKIWNHSQADGITGIDLQTENQLRLVNSFTTYYSEIPFTPEKQPKTRYYYENGFYSYTDSILLYSMIRHYRPKRIIEAGSGFSSAVMLDTNELFFNNTIQLTFIEPYPKRLNSLITDKDKHSATIIKSAIQEIPLETFAQLQAGDILFIDSTHVAKTGSDVNYILFEVLPCLQPGVLIHFHDVFYPFEYPKEWVLKGRNWNEDYFLKAFLMYNNQYEIKLFPDYLHKYHKDVFKGMPLTYKNFGGSFWLQKK